MSESNVCLSANCSTYLSGSIGQTFISSLELLFAAQCLLTENWPPDASDYITDLEFDYIVIGAGSAGSVVAGRLSEDLCRRVLLIEAGGDPPLASIVPYSLAELVRTQYDWQYFTENDGYTCQGSLNGKCYWQAGKVLGGGSSVNAMKYTRGNRRDYDNIARMGNSGWDYDEVLKYFKKSENMSNLFIKNDPILSSYHGFDGPMGTSTYDVDDPLERKIVAGFKEVGFAEVFDINGPVEYGLYREQATIQYGKRASTARAFLVPARDRPNFILLEHALATKIIFEGNTAVGVDILLQNGTTITATANLEVIVSAGSIRTPQLLMLSGIGPKSHLQQFNIPVIADLPVGKNLYDHFCAPMPVTITTDIPTRTPMEIASDVAEYIALQTGVYSIQAGEMARIRTLFNTNDPFYVEQAPNIIVYESISPKNTSNYYESCLKNPGYKPAICDSLAEINSRNTLYMISPVLLHPISRGNISLASTNPLDYPKIYPNALDDPNDMIRLLEAIRIMENLTETPSFKCLGAKIERVDLPPCNSLEFQSDEFWICSTLQLGTQVWHTLGTASMGPSSDTAVVNDLLQVYNVNNLRVVDGSVIPGPISANSHPAIIMFAERASDLIKEAHKNDKCVIECPK